MIERKSLLRRVQRQFERCGEDEGGRVRATDDDVSLLISHAGEAKEKRALDVATGGGHTAIALARVGATVTAIDRTYEMLEAASGFATENGVTIEFVQCPAEELRFESESFDLVTCRGAPHRLADPRSFVAEAGRVLSQEGRLLVIDDIAPAEPDGAQAVNEVGQRLDSSHIEAYSVYRWIDWLVGTGFDPDLLIRWRRTEPFRDRAEHAGLSESEISELEADIRSFPESVKAYLRTRFADGQLVSMDREVALFGARRTDLPLE